MYKISLKATISKSCFLFMKLFLYLKYRHYKGIGKFAVNAGPATKGISPLHVAVARSNDAILLNSEAAYWLLLLLI